MSYGNVPPAQNVHLSRRLQEPKQDVARAATDEFLDRHPGWIDRYGERARRLGEEDAEYHLEFLACALVAGSVESFRWYVRWTANMLGSRGIEPRFLQEFLELIGEELARRLNLADWQAVRSYLEAGVHECRNLRPSGVEDESP